MTKKHFIALADALRRHWNGMTPEAQEAIIYFCKRENPRFLQGRWLEYINGVAGPNGGRLKQPK